MTNIKAIIPPISPKSVQSSLPGQNPAASFKSVLEQVVKAGEMQDEALAKQLNANTAAQNAIKQMSPEQAARYIAQFIPEAAPSSFKKKKLTDTVYQGPIKMRDDQSDGRIRIAQALPQADPIPLAIPENTFSGQGEDPGVDLVNQPIFQPQQQPDELQGQSLNVTPFQFFLDKALEFFQRVSGMEMYSDSLMELYSQGKASIEDVTIEKAKVSVAISFAVTVLSQITAAFKEIQNMQI